MRSSWFAPLVHRIFSSPAKLVRQKKKKTQASPAKLLMHVSLVSVSVPLSVPMSVPVTVPVSVLVSVPVSVPVSVFVHILPCLAQTHTHTHKTHKQNAA